MDLIDKARIVLVQKLYPKLVLLMQDMNIDDIIINPGGDGRICELKIYKNGNLSFKDTLIEYNDITENFEGFKEDTIADLHCQILLFSRKIAELKMARNEILNALKLTERNSDVFSDYYSIILEKNIL